MPCGIDEREAMGSNVSHHPINQMQEEDHGRKAMECTSLTVSSFFARDV